MQRLKYLFIFLGLLSQQALSAPGDIIFQEHFNNDADLTADWSISATTMRANSVTGSPSPSLSIEGRQFSQSATSIAGRIDAAVPAATLSFWVRRGFDTQSRNCLPPGACSEYPEGGENLGVDYLDSSNNWIRLITYTGGGTQGEVFNFSQSLPANALHSGLRLRFVHLGGNTNQAGWDFWHVDAVVVTEAVDVATACSSTTTIFSESFNNNGDLNSDWERDSGVRINSVTSGAASPSVSFDGRGGLHGITSRNNRIDANVTTARLSFWVRKGFDTQGGGCPNNQNCSEYPDTGEDFQVEYRNSSGNWVLLQEYFGGGISGEIFNHSQLLPADALHDNLRLRFRHTGGSGSTWDFWHLDDVLVEECTSGSSVDHYSISLPQTAVSCEPLDITIAAHDSSHNLVDAQSVSVSLTTSTGRGTWSGTGVTDTTANDGQASLSFQSGDDSVTVQLSHPDLGGNTSEQLHINVSDGSISETSGSAIPPDPPNFTNTDDPRVTITDSGFRFIEVNGSTVTALIPGQVAGSRSTENLYIEAIRTDNDTGSCVGVYGAGTTVNLELAAECNNPSNCAGRQVAITRNTGPVSIETDDIATVNDNGGVGASAYGTLDVYFAEDSRAAFNLEYPDVGAISLHVRDVVNLPGGVTESLQGSSGFVVKPHQIEVYSVSTNDTVPVVNPGTTGSGDGFVASGRAFNVEVRVLNADGDVTPNFGNEIVPETVDIEMANLVYPSGAGNSGILSTTNPFVVSATPGVFENDTVSWNEVGSFTLTARVEDNDYLGEGNPVEMPESGAIGRFYPEYFQLDSHSVSHSCRGYSYLSEPALELDYQLSARNTAGDVVTNYDESLTYQQTASPVYHAENANNGIDLNALGTQFQENHNVTWGGGIFSFDNSGAVQLAQLNRFPAPTAPYDNLQLSLSVTETETGRVPGGVEILASQQDQNPETIGDCLVPGDCSSVTLGGSLILRYGRAILESAHGSEAAPLPVVFGVQYWDGVRFIDANTDGCTEIAYSAINMAGSTPVSNPQAVSVGSGTTNGSMNGGSGLGVITIGGSFNLLFSAPNTTGSFPVDVNLASYPWLRSDWNQDNDYDSENALPQAIISFGSYRGHDRVIYWRERFD